MNAPKFCLIPPLVVLMLTGCEPAPFTTGAAAGDRVCVDADKNRVDDYRCAGSVAYAGSHPFGAYYWWYMPRMGGGYIPPVGNLVSGGGGYYRPLAGGLNNSSVSTSRSSSNAEGVARGGFGSTARSFGGSAAAA